MGSILAQQQLLGPVRPDVVTFTVYGDAKPGGSKRAFKHPHTGRIIITEDSKNTSWRQDVASAGLTAIPAGMAPLWRGEPLRVEFSFFRPRPQGHYGSGANAGRVRASAPDFPSTRPDVLKLARAVEDALTGILWRDDAQIVDERLRKCWGEPARVEIAVWVAGAA
jgi:Holliday junction resolvase RusA-like endonuclease